MSRWLPPPPSALLTGLLPAVLFLTLLAGACGEGGRPGDGGPGRPPPASGTTAAPEVRFTDVSEGSGVVLENVSGDPKEKLAIPENIGQGAAVLDFDRDGLFDLFVANGDVFEDQRPRAEARGALYRNLGGFRFEDATERAGLVFKAWCHGVTAVDFDADGHTDLYFTVFNGPNRFFRNQGDGTFEDASAAWGGGDPGPSTAAAFFDADQDGDLDLYVGNYVLYDRKHPPNGGRPCDWKGLVVSCGPRGTEAAPDAFYRNEGGRLVLAGADHGFAAVKPAYCLGLVTGDYDNDGDVDLYATNDSVANYLFENQGGGRFKEVAFARGVAMSESGNAQAGMGVDFGDVDNDGRFEYFVTNFSHDHNTLYHNMATRDGGTLFDDVTYAMRLGEASFPMLSWGTRILDLDFDGWADIVVVSGHVYPQVDGANLGTTYAQRNQVFLNEGKGATGRVAFKERAAPPGDAFAKVSVSRGLAAGDLDNDGDPDFLIVEMDARPTLIRNDTKDPGRWIGFTLAGPGGNVEAIGARITVVDSRGVERHRERSGGSSFLSSGDPRVVFGLGPAGGPVASVRVRWPDGSTGRFENLETNRYWRLRAGASGAEAVDYPRS